MRERARLSNDLTIRYVGELISQSYVVYLVDLYIDCTLGYRGREREGEGNRSRERVLY